MHFKFILISIRERKKKESRIYVGRSSKSKSCIFHCLETNKVVINGCVNSNEKTMRTYYPRKRKQKPRITIVLIDLLRLKEFLVQQIEKIDGSETVAVAGNKAWDRRRGKQTKGESSIHVPRNPSSILTWHSKISFFSRSVFSSDTIKWEKLHRYYSSEGVWILYIILFVSESRDVVSTNNRV